MTILYIIVEGPTEEGFVKAAIQPALAAHMVLSNPIQVGPPKRKSDGKRRRGGDTSLGRVKSHLVRQLKQHNCHCSTLLDYYALGRDFTKLPGPSTSDIDNYAREVEQQIAKAVSAEMGNRFDPSRLIPYVQMHEFEALLFSDPHTLAIELDRPDAEEKLVQAAYNGPERINDSKHTAPSKRIEALQPRYQKVSDGRRIALKLGLPTIRAKCERFNAWLEQLERLGSRG